MRGHSSLRAETKNNPRNLPCPTCGEPNRLTRIDRHGLEKITEKLTKKHWNYSIPLKINQTNRTMNINDKTNGRFAEIIIFVANSKDEQIKKSFIRSLLTIAAYAKDEPAKGIDLYTDFARLSMTFAIFNEDGKLRMNGGFIYHPGPGEPAEENFTTQLDNSYGFSIHT